MMRHLMFIYVLIFILVQGHGFTEDLSLHERYLENVQRLARLEEGQKTIIEKFEAVDQRFEAMNKQFETVNNQFEAVDQRFEAMNKQFEAVDQRFEAMNKQFEAVNKQFEAVDQRFDSLIREMNQRFEAVDQRFDSLIREMNQRFETLDKRIDLIANHVSNLDNHFLTILAAIIGLIAYIIWDRKTAFDGVYKKIEQLFQSHIEQFHDSESVTSQVTHDNNSDKELSEVGSIKSMNNTMTIPRNIQEQFQNVVNFMNQFPETRQGGMATA